MSDCCWLCSFVGSYVATPRLCKVFNAHHRCVREPFVNRLNIEYFQTRVYCSQLCFLSCFRQSLSDKFKRQRSERQFYKLNFVSLTFLEPFDHHFSFLCLHGDYFFYQLFHPRIDERLRLWLLTLTRDRSDQCIWWRHHAKYLSFHRQNAFDERPSCLFSLLCCSLLVFKIFFSVHVFSSLNVSFCHLKHEFFSSSSHSKKVLFFLFF